MLSLVSCLDCTAVCVVFPSESFARLLNCVFCFAFFATTFMSFSHSVSPLLSAALSLLSTCFSLFLFICSPSVGFWAYVVFPSLRQCFSSCQTFSLSVSPFILFSLSLASLLVYAYMCMWACVHECFSVVFALQPNAVFTWARTVLLNKPFTIRGVKYFSIKKYISVLRSLRILTADIEKKLQTVRWKTSSVSRCWLIHIMTNSFSLNSGCRRGMHTYV